MELNTQTIIRTIIPGLIIYIVFSILRCEKWEEIQLLTANDISLSDGWSFIIIIFSGIFYNTIRIRNILWNPIKNRLQNEVENKLLSPFKNKIDNETLMEIKKNRKIIYQIFYPLINNDENLKVQARFIFFNGAILTSIIDLITILSVPTLYMLISYLFVKEQFLLQISILFLIIIAVALILLPISIKRHFNLSKGEIEYIISMKKENLTSGINLLIANMSLN